MHKYILLLSLLGVLTCGLSKKIIDTNPILETTSPEKEQFRPKNIILMVGDGMGVTQISAGLYSNNNKLNLERFKVIGLHKSYASNDLITDSAAGATAFSCGVKTYNGAIGVDADTMPVKTILEHAEDHGLATGLVATSTITHATPGSFAAHQKSRKMHEEIALDMAKSEVDLMIGGGKQFFENRKDERNLIEKLEKKGHQVTSFIDAELDEIKTNKNKFTYFTSNKDPLPVAAGRTYLPFASKMAPNFLKNHPAPGFFLMIEGSQIDWGGHANDADYIISEMKDFDRAVGNVLDFAEKDGETLVIVTADHETGGFAINKGSKMGDLVTAFTSDYHTADLIPVFAYGPGAEAFMGIYENTAIFDKMMKAFNFKK